MFKKEIDQADYKTDLNLHDVQKKILMLYCATSLQLHARRNHQ